MLDDFFDQVFGFIAMVAMVVLWIFALPVVGILLFFLFFLIMLDYIIDFFIGLKIKGKK